MSDLPRGIGEFLDSSDWTDGEKFIIKYRFRLLGDFKAALGEAIARADDDNLALLHSVFPDEVDGFIAWSRGGLAERLRKAGLAV